MARTKPAEERRADLLDAGLELFCKRGFSHSTVSEIAQRAGVAQGTFYLHFSSKEALLCALQDRFEDRIVARARVAIADAGPDWGTKFDAFVVACFENYAQELAQHDVLFAHLPREAHRSDSAGQRGEGLIGVIAGLLAEASAASAIDVVDREVTALLLFSALHGGFDEVVHLGPSIARERLVPALQTLVRRTVGYL